MPPVLIWSAKRLNNRVNFFEDYVSSEKNRASEDALLLSLYLKEYPAGLRHTLMGWERVVLLDNSHLELDKFLHERESVDESGCSRGSALLHRRHREAEKNQRDR